MQLSAAEPIATPLQKPGHSSRLTWGALALATAVVAVSIWAATDYRESEHQLHNAYVLYPTTRPLTYAALDAYADEVATAANVSQSRGRLIVEAFLKDRFDPATWTRRASAAPRFWALEGDRIAANGIASH